LFLALPIHAHVIVKLKRPPFIASTWLRAGAARIDSLPRILGADGAGIVHAIGRHARGVDPALRIGASNSARSLCASMNESPRQRSLADRRQRREGN